jgi:exonuclease VII large subunit
VAAAFFDLDRTLIAGSSAFEFGRAAYKAGMLSRRQLARDAWENVLFRLKGSTDERTDALKKRIGEALAGTRVRLAGTAARLDALSPLAILARGYAAVRRADDGRLVSDPAAVAPGDSLDIRVARGEIAARVEATRKAA